MKYYEHFYKNHMYSIFAPGLERFILVDNTDFWITMQTAELLCSKLPTVMFISPVVEMGNPTDYTILNKGQFKIGPSSMSTGRQNPQMKYLRNKSDIVFEGKPVDSTDNQLIKLTEFAKYVHELSYAINMTEALYNPYDNSTFLEKYIGLENIDGLVHKKDRSHKNVFNLIRRCVYDGTTVEDIKQRIVNVWLENYHEQEYLLIGFYQTLQEPIPDTLKNHTKYVPETVSTYIV